MIGPAGDVTSLITQRMLGASAAQRNTSLERLATGLRINRGADDPAGLISSENLRAVLASLEAETRLLERADRVVATADGAMTEASDLLVEAEGLAVASANTAGMSDAEREANQMQLDSILQTVGRLSRTTEFNGDRLLDGSATVNVAGESVDLPDVSPTNLGLAIGPGGENYRLSDTGAGGALNLVSGDPALAAQAIRSAASEVATSRGRLGAFQANIIEPARNSTLVAIENIAAANSIIRDTDYAAETAQFARASALFDTNIAMNALTNANRTNALILLG